MKFFAREDIAAPLESVFTEMSDFAAFERIAMRYGADVERHNVAGAATNGTNEPWPVGTGWEVGFKFRGRARKLSANLSEMDAPNGYTVESKIDGLVGDAVVELVPLSPRQTRLHITVELKPKTLSARLLVQSVKLARNRMNKRCKKRVSEMATMIEERSKA